ncbi:putative porin [Massilibacteroides sp.]|uniref:putative porin n=1 Tax=Massilibacteroides sp. TaxID=2034766 RepID=UPI002639B252|nr:putative porin [Massilibacteroides sp.]MDD4514258.1 putative porin [Massilibacteroides sp.]
MKYCLYIFIIIIISVSSSYAQQGGGQRGGFSLSNLASSKNALPDSLLFKDSTELKNKRIIAYSLTPYIGDSYIAPLDTNKLNYANSTLMDGHGLSVAYLGNVGSPAQSRIFSERGEARDFIFADGYNYYKYTPENVHYFDVKTPYSNVTYTFGGASINKEERLKGVLTTNFGKKINVGADFDYIYGRGFYNSNGTKLVSYRLFGSYRSDRYELNAYLSNQHFVINENGGISETTYITDPDSHQQNNREIDSKSIPTRYSTTWNRVRNKQYYLTHRYNLGFVRTLDDFDEEGNAKEIFVPVSSIIHTFEYEDNRRRFYSSSTAVTDTSYQNIYNLDPELNDRMSSWNYKNTFALSLREGFQDWVKLGLTAFIRFEQRKFRTQAPIQELIDNPIKPGNTTLYPTLSLDFPLIKDYSESSTYLGGEIYKRQGSILTYNARGELAIVGDDIGEFRLDGELQTRFNLFNKELSIKANGYIKNVTPAFFQRHFYSRYFWWDNKLKNTKQVYVGGEAKIEATETTLSAGVESIENYVFFNSAGVPEQSGSNIQIVSARLKQDFHYKAFGWENEIVYQLSSEKKELPLPQVSAYTNIYLATKLAKVLTVQIGADAHYFTEYDAPYYEPATQQFQLQRKGYEMKVGNYPLVNAYVNFHLKQTRFFIMMYNVGTLFTDPNYFSLANYPLNPMHLKFGLSVNFNN